MVVKLLNASTSGVTLIFSSVLLCLKAESKISASKHDAWVNKRKFRVEDINP